MIKQTFFLVNKTAVPKSKERELTSQNALLRIALETRRDVIEVSQTDHNVAHSLAAFFKTLRSVAEGFVLLKALLHSLNVGNHFYFYFKILQPRGVLGFWGVIFTADSCTEAD